MFVHLSHAVILYLHESWKETNHGHNSSLPNSGFHFSYAYTIEVWLPRQSLMIITFKVHLGVTSLSHPR